MTALFTIAAGDGNISTATASAVAHGFATTLLAASGFNVLTSK